MNPQFASDSVAFGISGAQQVGQSTENGNTHAVLWSGSAASRVDLNPPGVFFSTAYAVSGGRQVGLTNSGVNHAALWSGTAASRVDLHPAGASFSECNAIGGAQQVGRVYINGASHAALWTGSAASYVDLAPTNATYSWAYGVSANQQVGYAQINEGTAHAAYWSGSAASHVDLGALIPGNFADSKAYAISTSGGVTSVVGYGYNRTTNRNEAILWTRAAPCAADFNGTGGLTVQDIFDFLNAWFASLPSADFNHVGGITVQDIFDFLNAWFTGCP